MYDSSWEDILENEFKDDLDYGISVTQGVYSVCSASFDDSSNEYLIEHLDPMFLEALAQMPPDYEREASKESWRAFFENWGTGYVSQVR